MNKEEMDVLNAFQKEHDALLNVTKALAEEVGITRSVLAMLIANLMVALRTKGALRQPEILLVLDETLRESKGAGAIIIEPLRVFMTSPA